MKKLLILIITVIPLLSCSDSPVDLSAYQGINYISSLPFDAGVETNWVRSDATGTYFDFAVIVPSTTTGLPSGTTDYARLEILNLMTDGGFEGGVGTWTNIGLGAIGIASGVNAINPGNNSLQFTDVQQVDFNLNTIPGLADNTEYVIHFKFNKSTPGTTVFDYHNNASSYLSNAWSLSTSLTYLSNDFPTLSGENNIINVATAADNHFFSIGEYGGSSQVTGHVDDFKIVRNDITLNITADVPYTASERLELISGIYEFSIYVKREIAANINPATANRFPSETVTLYINNNPTAFDISSVTDASWVQISAKQSIQIFPEDIITLSVTANNTTTPGLKESGSILIAAPALYYISD